MPDIDNAKLAEKVLGWRQGTDPRSSKAYPVNCWFDKRNGMRGQNPPDFANDIAAAFMLLEAIGLRWSITGPDHECFLHVAHGGRGDGVGASGQTPAAAITAAVWAWLKDQETTNGR